MIEDVRRHSTLESAVEFIQDNFPELYAEVIGKNKKGVEFTDLVFKEIRLLKSVGVVACLHFRSLNCSPEEIMRILEKAGIYITRPIFRNARTCLVLMRDDEWSALAMHLRLLGVLDGTYDLNE